MVKFFLRYLTWYLKSYKFTLIMLALVILVFLVAAR